MTDRENFLERWSRKKAAAEGETADAPAAPEPAIDDCVAEPPDATTPSSTTAKPEFDLASLPSLESITKATDIRAFLTPGVPLELTRAALRRAWVADPAIRDFVGLQENAWDFTDPNGVPGFGDIAPDYDIKKLLAQIFGEPKEVADPIVATQRHANPADEQTTETIAKSETTQDLSGTTPSHEDDGDHRPATTYGAASTEALTLRTELVQRNNNIATHNSHSRNQSIEPKIRRQHGRALPE